MIIHIDSGNARPMEQKVRDLIKRQIYVKRKEEADELGAEWLTDFVYADIHALARAEYDMDRALEYALEAHPEFRGERKQMKRNDLERAIEEHASEIDALMLYFDSVRHGVDEVMAYEHVNSVLCGDEEFLDKKLREIVARSIWDRVQEPPAELELSKGMLTAMIAEQLQIIASHKNIEDALNEVMELPGMQDTNRDNLRTYLQNHAATMKREIDALRMALSMHEQEMETAAVLQSIRQLLGQE